MNETKSFHLRNLDDTRSFATVLGRALPNGSVVCLIGTLGAGKSQLVRFLAESLSVDPESVTSPTFTLWNTYQGDRMIHHLDAYRLNGEDEFWEIGGEELFEQDGLIFIEWADRIRGALPKNVVRIELEVLNESERMVVVETTNEGDFLENLFL